MSLAEIVKSFNKVVIAIFSIFTVSCASTGYDDYGDYGDYGSNYNYNSASTTNVTLNSEPQSENSTANAYTQDPVTNGESLNNTNGEFENNIAELNDSYNYLADTQGINGNNSESLNAILNETDLNADYQAQDFTQYEANAPLLGQSANEIPGNYAAPDGKQTSASITAGIVKYATRRVDILSQNDGIIVGFFEKGDHPVVYEGENSPEFSDGTQANWTAFTEAPIGRQRKQGDWR